MEFWDGWFTAGRNVIQGSQRSWQAVHEVLGLAPLNLYMFMAEPISALWMGAQLEGSARFATGH